MEKKIFKSYICVLCGKSKKGRGNNARPIRDGECCDCCNKKKVIPERIRRWNNNEFC